MAITIKSIPVLTGAAAERFVKMAEVNEGKASATIIPQEICESIRQMMERSRRVIIKHPTK